MNNGQVGRLRVKIWVMQPEGHGNRQVMKSVTVFSDPICSLEDAKQEAAQLMQFNDSLHGMQPEAEWTVAEIWTPQSTQARD